MPLIGTRGAASARGFGMFGAVAGIGGDNYLGTMVENNGSPNYFLGNAALSGNTVFIAGQGVDSGLSGAAIVAKYNSTGTLQWKKSWRAATSVPVGIVKCATSSSGSDVYVLAPLNTASGNGSAVIKIDTNGSVVWQKQILVSGYTLVLRDIVVNSSGETFCTGYLYTDFSQFWVYTIKLTSTGTLSATHAWAGSAGSFPQANGIALNEIQGTVYVTGVSDPSYGRSGVFVWEYGGSTLNTVRRQQYNHSAWNSSGNGVIRASSTDVWVAASRGGSTACALRLNSTLGLTSSRDYSVALTSLVDVAADSADSPYFIGQGGSGAYTIIKTDSSGTTQWIRNYSNSVASVGVAGAIDITPSGANDYIFVGYQSFGPGSTYEGSFGKLPNDGSKQGTYNVGAYSFTYGSASVSEAASSFTAVGIPSSTTISPTTTVSNASSVIFADATNQTSTVLK